MDDTPLKDIFMSYVMHIYECIQYNAYFEIGNAVNRNGTMSQFVKFGR